MKKYKVKREKVYVIRWICIILGVLGCTILGFNISNANIINKKEIVATIKNGYGVKINEEEINILYKALDVQKPDFKWNGDLEGANIPNQIFIHHSVKDIDVNQVHEMHLDNEWAGIGYHYFIDDDGKIYEARPENKRGAHAKENNVNSLGICLRGNFEVEKLGEVQKKSLLNLLEYLTLKYEILDIRGHGNVNETLCPGKNIDVEALKEELDNIIVNKYESNGKIKSNSEIYEITNF